MSDERLKALYESVTAARTDPTRAGCVSPEGLRRLVDQEESEASRLELLDHVMACSACHGEFELLRSIGQGAKQDQRHRVPRWTMAAAASVVLLIGGGVVWRSLGPEAQPFRGAAGDIELISPVGQAADGPLRLVWEAVPEVLSYRLEVLDGSGALVHAAETQDTSYLVPDTVPLQSGTELMWWVRGVMRDGSERTGGPVRFTPDD